ncbi:MAG: NAD-dependent epimerase/dehydratase family protein, partial [Gammaproteobacteria bacterium]|nr:NAD-dependent epimerase/dehydratase family protein [Gammaproteobacteria bacterium]
DTVVGFDNLNDYYDPSLKAARLARLAQHPRFRFEKGELADRSALAALVARERCTRVVHLAAQAGVRHSIDHPQDYIDSNVTGFLNVLEACRENGIEHLVYASTSSVYGANTHMPFAESQNVDHPLSMYAATKKANELMAHTYAALHGLPTTGLRFFTVYGPWGRPDMALFRFTKNILAGLPIDVYNEGRHQRDFTYIDDITSGVLAAVDRVASADPDWDSGAPDPATSRAPYRIYNIGNQRAVPLLRYIEVLEECLGRKAEKRMLPMQAGDVPDTYSDVSRIARDLGYHPRTAIETGVRRFVEWYREYYPV